MPVAGNSNNSYYDGPLRVDPVLTVRIPKAAAADVSAGTSMTSLDGEVSTMLDALDTVCGLTCAGPRAVCK